MRTLVEYFQKFYRHGRDTAYVYRRGYRTFRWTYLEVAEAACRFARELDARSIEKGDKVLIWGDNSAEWVVAFLGSALKGVVAVPLDRIASPDFVRRVARRVTPRLCVCSRELVAFETGAPSLILEDLTSALSGHSHLPYAGRDLTPEDVVEIVFTSGTTAEPKGVVITHKNILANLRPLDSEIQKYLKYERIVHPLRFLNLLPLSHVFGQFLGVFIPQLLGATVVFQDSLNPSEIQRTVKRERVSVLIAVPRLLETLRDKIERDFESMGKLEWFRRQLRNSAKEHFMSRWWRFRRIHHQFGWKFWAFISGGAALDGETEQFWTRLGFVVIQGYGLTETTSLVSVQHPFRLGKGSIGKVLPGREIKLGASGEILVRGESISSGYYQEKQLQPVSGEEGWFHTGDIGELDAQGNLYFKGRQKNVIVTPEGMNIYPEDLEAALRTQPEVRDCVVVGLSRGGNAEPCAVLILKRAADPAPIVGRANDTLAEFQHIRHWFIWPDDDFPRTSTQKPKTALIQQKVQSELKGLPKEDADVPAATLVDLISRITKREISNVAHDANLATDLHLSSIERVELLGALEDRYQVDLNESRFTAAMTVADLERMIKEPTARRSDYKYPRWAQRWPVRLLRIGVYYLLSWPATVLMARPRVQGRENLEGLRTPLLFISNHITQVDIGFVLIALPPHLRHRLAVAMLGELLRSMRHPPSAASLFKRWMEKASYGLVVALFNVFPLPQQTGFRESFAFAGESADRGYSILVFPEGRRTQDGRLSCFQTGIGMLARNLGLPVVPIRIDGLFELKRMHRLFASPGAVTVSIGAPVRFAPGGDAEGITRELERRMMALARETSTSTGREGS